MVDPITSSSASSSASSLTNGNSAVGKDEFMKMLIAQLKNQDPMNPMDGTQFAAQLAQFSSLEQLTNLNENVQNSIDANYLLSQSINNTMSTTLIGKEVKLDSNSINYTGQDSVDFEYDLPSNAQSVTVKIYNDAGALIKTIENAPKDMGSTKLNWDFTDNAGRNVQHGDYTIKIEAADSAGNTMSNVSTYLLGVINGVKFGPDGSSIVIDGNEYWLSQIVEITDPNTNAVDNSNSKDDGR